MEFTFEVCRIQKPKKEWGNTEFAFVDEMAER